MSSLFDSEPFEPTLAAAQARIAAVKPAAYARTRNAIDGAATGLSPYITHGFTSLPEVLHAVLQREPLPVQHKLVYEFGWREYFQHVWAHLGEGIFESLHTGLLPDTAYARELPADIREGRTGVPAIDCAVRALYSTGHLHNHARMWLASYVVHLRKVHWRAGADWLYGHLLDGDLASNHLSWQWVAGTGSSKPYLFNADNVERHAPAAWHSRGSVIDQSYEALDHIARQAQSVAAAGGSGVEEPPLLPAPPLACGTAPDAAAVAGREVRLVHAWSLAAVPPGALSVGLLDSSFHARWPWSAARWHFVTSRMRAATTCLWWGTADAMRPALRGAARIQGLHNLHLGATWAPLPWSAAPRLLHWPAQRCGSFSQFWHRATKGLVMAAELGPFTAAAAAQNASH
jgi:deoxyribodipyrimidine photo-lyase